MGFFSGLLTTEAEKNKGKILQKVKDIPDFSAQKQYWSCDDNPLMGVMLDNINKKIVLLGHYKFSFTATMQLLVKLGEQIEREHPSLSKNERGKLARKMQEEYIKQNQYFARIYDYKDILRSEVVEDGNSITYTNRTSQAASAAIGYALTGGIGAIIGGLTGKKKNVNTATSVVLRIVMKDTQNPLFQIAFLNNETEKKSKYYKQAIDIANELHALVSILIEQANDQEAQQVPKASFSIADELQKLSNLLEQGMLNKEEYETLKAKVIAKV